MRRGLGLLVPALLFPFLIVSMIAGCANAPAKIEMVTVPGLVGQSLEEAQSLLRESGLETGEKLQAYSDTVPAGMIVSTAPASGEQLEEGSSIVITTSLGPEKVAVPPLLGKTETDASASLQALGLLAETRWSYNEQVAAGMVCGMEPVPDTSIPRGSKVILTVSQGSAYVTCDTCSGRGTVTTSETCPECGGTGTCYT
jgi:beta-lactam-binding protein with PASTA domain